MQDTNVGKMRTQPQLTRLLCSSAPLSPLLVRPHAADPENCSMYFAVVRLTMSMDALGVVRAKPGSKPRPGVVLFTWRSIPSWIGESMAHEQQRLTWDRHGMHRRAMHPCKRLTSPMQACTQLQHPMLPLPVIAAVAAICGARSAAWSAPCRFHSIKMVKHFCATSSSQCHLRSASHAEAAPVNWRLTVGRLLVSQLCLLSVWGQRRILEGCSGAARAYNWRCRKLVHQAWFEQHLLQSACFSVY